MATPSSTGTKYVPPHLRNRTSQPSFELPRIEQDSASSSSTRSTNYSSQSQWQNKSNANQINDPVPSSRFSRPPVTRPSTSRSQGDRKKFEADIRVYCCRFIAKDQPDDQSDTSMEYSWKQLLLIGADDAVPYDHRKSAKMEYRNTLYVTQDIFNHLAARASGVTTDDTFPWFENLRHGGSFVQTKQHSGHFDCNLMLPLLRNSMKHILDKFQSEQIVLDGKHYCLRPACEQVFEGDEFSCAFAISHILDGAKAKKINLVTKYEFVLLDGDQVKREVFWGLHKTNNRDGPDAPQQYHRRRIELNVHVEIPDVDVPNIVRDPEQFVEHWADHHRKWYQLMFEDRHIKLLNSLEEPPLANLKDRGYYVNGYFARQRKSKPLRF